MLVCDAPSLALALRAPMLELLIMSTMPNPRTSPSILARLAHPTWMLCIATSILLGPAALARASDGVVELSQTCAVSTGCLAGDAPGFPIVIASPGSFILTSDLDVRVATSPVDTTAIDVQTGLAGTTIDLNGFSLIGPASCSFLPPCTSTGTGQGVAGVASVKNGTVRGMGSDGVSVSGDVEGVRAIGNGGRGIAVSFGTLSRSVAAINGATGLSATNGSVESSVSSQNQSLGLSLNRSTGENLSIADNAGIEVSLSRSRLGHSLIDENGGGEVSCTDCALTGNQFSDCVGAACLGAGTIFQVPAGSNLCGNVVCP